MTYITSFAGPDLSDAKASLVSHFMNAVVFQGRAAPTQESSRLVTGLLTVIDKAIREYIAGRETLILYSQSSNETAKFIEGLGRLETCLNSVKRAFRFLTALTSVPGSPSLDRTLRRLLQSWEKKLTSLRDAIEHIDGDIVGSNIADGQAHLLAINHDGEHLELLGHRLSVTELASVLRNLHRAGVELIESLPAPTS